VKLAVNRWIRYWDQRLLEFGSEKAFLPMTIEGAMKGCEKILSSTYVSVAEGVADPDGRAIVLLDFREESGHLSDKDLFRVAYYRYHVALSSELAQKRGIIFYSRLLDNFFDGRSKLWKKTASISGTFPMRQAAYHIVSPPSYIEVLIKIAKLFLGPKLRNRLYVHSGSMDDILGSLSKYGLGSKDMLPDVFGGDLSFSPQTKLTLKC